MRDDRRARPSAPSPRYCTPRQANCCRCAREDGEVLVPFVSAIVTSVSLDDQIDRDRSARGSAGAGAEPMRIDVVTIFPDYLDPLRQSLPGKAIDAGIVDLAVHDLRRWTHDVHRSVDDSPYGGGPGMVMKAPVWGEALDEICSDETLLVVPTPAGRLFTPGRRATLEHREAPGVRVRALRGHRPTRRRRCGPPDAGRRGLDRRLRAARRRVGGAGDDRGGRSPAARRARQSRVAPRRFAFRRPAGGAELHPAAELAWTRRARGAAVGRPRARSRRGGANRRCSAPASAAPTCSTSS